MRTTPLFFLTLPGLLSLGCQSQTHTASLNCPEIGGLEHVLGPDSPEIIIIGEFHGTTASPELVSALTCWSLSAGLSTTLALEIYDDDGRLDTFLKSNGSDQARQDFFEDPFWTTGFTDGRSSEAMLGMMDRARVWMSEDRDFKVHAFANERPERGENETRNESAGAWEAHMAKGVLDAASGRDKTIVLVGNLHARRGRRDYGGLDYKYMAEYLPRDTSLTLDTITTKGSAWYCSGQPVKCGEGPKGSAISANHPFAQGEPKIVMAEDMTDALKQDLRFDGEDYDGVVFVGQAKASPPANADNRRPLNVK